MRAREEGERATDAAPVTRHHSVDGVEYAAREATSYEPRPRRVMGRRTLEQRHDGVGSVVHGSVDVDERDRTFGEFAREPPHRCVNAPQLLARSNATVNETSIFREATSHASAQLAVSVNNKLSDSRHLDSLKKL